MSSPWPVVLKRIRTAGLTVIVNLNPKPVLRVETNLENLLGILRSRAIRGAFSVKGLLSIAAGLAILLAAVFIPIPVHNAATVSVPKVLDECSPAKLRQAIEGVSRPSKVEFIDSNAFGGVTAGILRCQGSRYSYTLESKGDERVLKVQKLNT